ncbi:hypothetical protein IEQ34_009843 [Dendrobium chrysotoxum]|uniref:Uncharacterized protein n=1 Tax=Dendrobium chrysotoxum TaxID=161865 RepID=A0AAV7H2N7_DENCH|nr:hypothetical protein IEQ34_009843 [Dendrobium chrysotoxum]
MNAPKPAPIATRPALDLTLSSSAPFGDSTFDVFATGASVGAGFGSGALTTGATCSITGASAAGGGAFASALVGAGGNGDGGVLLWWGPSMPGGMMIELIWSTDML